MILKLQALFQILKSTTFTMSAMLHNFPGFSKETLPVGFLPDENEVIVLKYFLLCQLYKLLSHLPGLDRHDPGGGGV